MGILSGVGRFMKSSYIKRMIGFDRVAENFIEK
jgi:hypothetical protein